MLNKCINKSLNGSVFKPRNKSPMPAHSLNFHGKTAQWNMIMMTALNSRSGNFNELFPFYLEI